VTERILVVDDDDFMRESLKLELETAGYVVSAAGSGTDALEVARRDLFDLVLCDVRMPGMSGTDALHGLKQLQPELRQIVITGYASADAPLAALKLRVDDYLMKPFSTDELLRSVRLSLEQRRRAGGSDVRALRQRQQFLRLLHDLASHPRAQQRLERARRMARLSVRVGRALGLAPRRLQGVELAALLHDLGQTELSGDDASLLPHLQQALVARDILEPFEEMRDVGTFLLHQHERWDGTGEPHHLRAAEIPLEARILAVVMAWERCRGEGKEAGPAVAFRALKEWSGHQLDPELVQVLGLLTHGRDDDALPPFSMDAPLSTTDLAEPSTDGILSLLKLADLYQALGYHEMATEAYEVAAEHARDAPEMLLRVRLSQAHMARTRGKFREALDVALEALRIARDEALSLESSQLVLMAAELKAGLDEAEPDLAASLHSARKSFVAWDAPQETVACDLVMAAVLARQNAPPAFDEAFERFLVSAREHRHLPVIASHGEAARIAVSYALANSRSESEVLCLLKGGGSAILQLLEGLLHTADVRVKLKVLDVLGELPHRQARLLLAGARSDAAAAVAEKSSLLLSRQQSGVKTALAVFLLGRFRVVSGDSPLDDEHWPTRKTRNLFAYLCAHRGRTVHEEKLMDLFWEQGGEKARHSLHNSISQIRKLVASLVGADGKAIARKKDGYVLERDLPCWIDLEEFEEEYRRARLFAEQGNWSEAVPALQSAQRLYGGDFLEGFYDDWVHQIRSRACGQLMDILRLLGTQLLDQGKPEVSADVWRQALVHDNCCEDAYLGLMRCHALHGRKSDAIKVYHQCVETLKKELDLAPPPALVEAYLRIVQST